MKKILWVAPNLNHYKSRFLNRLVQTNALNLTLISGSELKNTGHRNDGDKELFYKVAVDAKKEKFSFCLSVYIRLFEVIKNQRINMVMMPVEKKFIPLIIYLFILKFFFRFSLVSYNHPLTARKTSAYFNLEKKVNKLLFSLYDKVVFYTSQSRDWAVKEEIVSWDRAFFANNTLDTEQIWKNYTFKVNTSSEKTILFIGRLIPNKNIDLLFEYYRELKKYVSDIKLIIIGDGPMAYKVRDALRSDDSIIWRGAVVDENRIAYDMRRAHLVFVPGHSGLSIVHAFCYGKPYATLSSYKNHPPEIDYLQDDVNGLILEGNLVEDDCNKIISFLSNDIKYEKACRTAFETAKSLSIENWCLQMQKSLNL